MLRPWGRLCGFGIGDVSIVGLASVISHMCIEYCCTLALHQRISAAGCKKGCIPHV